ncbi:MAG: 2-amino-4-hydroxy-6-hydroxymethyldihydropteridine diphosphokinase [Cytophagales bacterium]|nr:2-amino-4-hydroxy-6-hydroxymethyldihydropteridine diphosphokinase [Cytophagales bacterium]
MRGIYLLLGSNMGDRMAMLEESRSAIEHRVGPVLSASSWYETEAWGVEDQASFLNQVLEVSSRMNPQQLLAEVLDIERDLGRERFRKWGERVIDIDILYFGERVVLDDNLKIPHPFIQERRFTLAPLAEIAPEFVHPLIGKSQQELLAICRDPLQVAQLIKEVV